MISPVLPLYYRTKQAILRYVEDHELQPGDVLPTEHDLEREFQVSRVTVRRALSEFERGQGAAWHRPRHLRRAG